jgi:transcription-repair coupling factor (superfamily II helicase)
VDAAFFKELERRVRDGEDGVCLAGLVEGARSVVLTLLSARLGRGLMLVVPDDASLDAHRRDLSAVAAASGRDPGRVVVLPALDANPYDDIPSHPEVARERVVALGRLLRREVDVLLLPARALLSWLPSPEEWASRTRVIRPGEQLPPERFVLEAMAAGYRRVDTVCAPGEVSRRGGIVDVFPPSADEPVRIELFGDAVDSLRAFDTDHQRSTRPLAEARVEPATENPPGDEALRRLAAYLEAGLVRARDAGGSVREFRQRLERLEREGHWAGLEALAGLTAARPVLGLDYAEELLLVVDEPERTDDELLRAAHDLRTSYEQSGDRVLPPPDRLFADPRALRPRLERAAVFLEELVGEPPRAARFELRASSRRARSYSGRIAELAGAIREGAARGGRTLCMMRAPGTAERLREVLAEYDVHAALASGPGEDEVSLGTGGVLVLVGGLRAGFELPEHGFTLLTEREVFGEQPKGAERRRGGRAAFVSDFRDLRPRDLVVHVDHGVARYVGLGRPKGGSLNRDFMVLEFAGADKLFVPVDRLDLVQKYRGVAGARPALDRLGGPGWERVKSRVRRSVESMARELLELYARRRACPGHAFGADTTWQRELEAAFPYELTPDQERAIAEVKRDMESPKPMDRLLVGDVGFGKTEVAVRAAFKAVMDGCQAAVLAPTTVLALQHYDTFRERFAPFPGRVEMVSRFRSAAEVREVLAGVERGEVDVLIGTHRLLSRDVCFRRLGLLVIDEEQRFGVAAKEKLKRISVGVDVLSMTATPIPRTLQMSLAGVRDLSVIETPPQGRMAIQTYVVPFRRNVIAQAIRQELRRKGQAFVVHDRVETLPSLARAVQQLVPEARLVVAHGQMPERQLEAAMLRFLRYDADILVTTTIIENGLDIPRANTMIVNRADCFGLAQLYQLRGRVGRSEQHAYAYFIVPGRELLADAARKRLRALQEFGELGAGFRLAAADLEIRGAGEFLGTRQHGHIASLGFDLYIQMLERAVREQRGEAVEEPPAVSLHLGVDIKIPESYMADAGDRLATYKRVAGARDEAEIDRLQAETEDRYGHLPPAGRNLFDMARLRLVARDAGVKAVDVVNARLEIRFHERPPVDPRRVLELVAQEQGSLTPSGMLLLPAPEKASERVRAARGVLERILGRPAA